MTLILIIFCIWGCSALIRAYSAKQSQREFQRIDSEIRQRKAEQKQMAQELAQQKRDAESYVRRQIALEREQMKLAKEQQKQAEQIAKHDKRIADLEFKAEQASADIEHLRAVLDDLNESFEMACRVADKAHAAGDDKREEQAKNKILTLRNKIHSTESRIAKAQHTHDMAERELSA
jgi:chromosome segregation ATPase